jgi:hypothetical protein
LDLEGVEEVFGEGGEALVLIGGEDELAGGSGGAEFVEHVFGGVAVELLGGSVESEKKSQEDDGKTRRVSTHAELPFCCRFSRVPAEGVSYVNPKLMGISQFWRGARPSPLPRRVGCGKFLRRRGFPGIPSRLATRRAAFARVKLLAPELIRRAPSHPIE